MNKGSTHGFDSFPEEDWRLSAACRLVDPELFFTDTGYGSARRALHVCHTHCPVMKECAAWALDKKWDGVVVGGDYHRTRAASRSDAPDRPDSAAGCVLCRSES